MKGCAVLFILFVVFVSIYTLSVAFFLRLGWNYVVVDTLDLTTKYLTWKAAIILAFVLSVISNAFRANVKANE